MTGRAHDLVAHFSNLFTALQFGPCVGRAYKEQPSLFPASTDCLEYSCRAAGQARDFSFTIRHGSASRLLGVLVVGGRVAAAAARARRRRPAVRAQVRAREQVPGHRVGPGGVRSHLRSRGPRRAPGGAQHARRAGLGVPVVDHGRRAARRRVHGAAVPVPGVRHLVRRRRRQGLHGRRHRPRPRQLHPRARRRALQHPPTPRPQRTPLRDQTFRATLPTCTRNREDTTTDILCWFSDAHITSLFCGDPVKPHLLLLGICGTTVFISMWIHNTACTIMMMQVATGILQRLPRDQLEGRAGAGADAREFRRFSKALVLGIMYSSTIGGMATLTGTGANIILVGMWSTYFPKQRPITFSSWMSFGLPMAFILSMALWATLCLMYCSKNTGKVLSDYLDRSHLRRELRLMGPMAFAEKMVLAVFGGLIVLWMTRTLTNDVPGWAVLFDGKVGDGTVTILMATLLFIIPSGKSDGEKLMDWGKCRKLQWHIILLLGAGFAIADGFKSSGLTDILSSGLGFLKGAPAWAIAPAACVFSGIITEFTSDDAATTLVLPLLAELGKSIGVHPLLLMVPGTVGAQLSYLLPTATPGNVVGFGTGYITIKDMVVTGMPIKLVGVAALTLLLPTLGSVVFGMDSGAVGT